MAAALTCLARIFFAMGIELNSRSDAYVFSFLPNESWSVSPTLPCCADESGAEGLRIRLCSMTGHRASWLLGFGPYSTLLRRWFRPQMSPHGLLGEPYPRRIPNFLSIVAVAIRSALDNRFRVESLTPWVPLFRCIEVLSRNLL